MDRSAFSAQREASGRFSDAGSGGAWTQRTPGGGGALLQGLLMPGQRKSIEPMAAKLGVDAQGLQQFVSDSPWSDQAVWTVVRQQIIPHLEPMEAWVVDETGWLKQGQHSVGVSHQYCGSVGKQANCQVSVELVVSDGWIAAPIGGRIYLPESWTKDRARCARAGVPQDIGFATKPMIALQLLREALVDGVAPAPVLGDAAYGDNAEFRAGVRALDLEFLLQVDAAKHKGWNFEVPTALKQVRRHPTAAAPPSQTLVEIAAGIPADQWQAAHWKRASGERGATRLAWCEVWLQHALRKPGGELEKLWLVVDWPADAAEPYHYYLAHLHRAPAKARCLTLSRSRWHIEQYFQRAKDDLGFDHFESRSWTGFHHHLVLSALAYLFILTIHARAKKNFWCDVGTDVARDPAVAGEVDRLLLLLRQQI
ncbi:MAG: IS701 family transposase [Burkholderiaceae bacterium]